MNFLFSVIYPGSKKFFDDFINSVNIQTSKDFTLVLCLNGTNLNKKELNKIKVKYLLFKTNLDWRNARVKILKKLLKLKSEYIIFADSDDIMSKLRIEISLKKIKKYKCDFITNNIYLFGDEYRKKKIYLPFKNNFRIKLKDINDKNFVGCSNTIMKSRSLSKIIDDINIKLIGFDWCIAKLLILNKYKGFYIKNCLTFYRQHTQNNSRILNISLKQKKFDLREKINHFKYFSQFGLNYEKKINKLKSVLNDNKILKKIKKKKLWWDYSM